MSDRQYFSFLLGEGLFAVEILAVREILHRFELTPVDLAPAHVAGVMNLRGQIVTLLDIERRFGINRPRRDDPAHCIVMKTRPELAAGGGEVEGAPEDLVGLLVDEVEEVYTVPASLIEPPPAHLNGIDGRYLKEIVKLDGRLMTVIDLAATLSTD